MNNNNDFETKLQRLRAGKSPRVLDLFCGCGGLSLGFHSAGFQIAGGIEFDPLAARSHARNFFRGHPEKVIEHHAKPRDITSFTPLQAAADLGFDSVAPVDIIIGGPPCQAFSIVGRAKLREIHGHPEAFKNDPRAKLVRKFLNFVTELRPLAVLMENVPEILRYGENNIAEEVAATLDAAGYETRYTILNSVFYGVPQIRDRMFLIAFDKALNTTPTFPAPTHHYVLPNGYRNLRRDVVNKFAHGLFVSPYLIIPPENETHGRPAVTASDALRDLPPITLHLEGKLKRGARRFVDLAPYPPGRGNRYAQAMRNWPGFENKTGILDHVIRYLPRDYQIFGIMEPGDEYPQAHQKANALFNRKLQNLQKSLQKPLTQADPEYQDLLKKTVPPYDPSKFANKWRKIDANEPVRTLTAHIGKDTYSHIHYDSQQKRTISVREAARLQSFPDGFIFTGTLDPALRQIGNSVPPLIAKAIAGTILDQLTKAAKDIK